MAGLATRMATATAQLPRSSTGTRLKAGVPLSGSLTARISTLASG